MLQGNFFCSFSGDHNYGRINYGESGHGIGLLYRAGQLSLGVFCDDSSVRSFDRIIIRDTVSGKFHLIHILTVFTLKLRLGDKCRRRINSIGRSRSNDRQCGSKTAKGTVMTLLTMPKRLRVMACRRAVNSSKEKGFTR